MPDAGKPWLPEQVVSPALAQQLIDDQFPTLQPARVISIGDGWDNTAYRVNDAWVFRFPRRTIAAEIMLHEIKVLPLVAKHVSLPVPEPVFVGEPCEAFPWHFVGARFIPGVTACSAQLDHAARVSLAPALGSFLRAQHAIPCGEAQGVGAPPDTMGRLDLPKRIDQVQQRIEQATSQGLDVERSLCASIIAALPRTYTPRTDTLVHGDLYFRHVMIDESSTVCGIIDWGDVHLGDPAVDLSLIAGSVPLEGHGSFAEHYGGVSEDAWSLARFKAMHLALAILVFGHDAGDDALLSEARFILGNLAASAS